MARKHPLLLFKIIRIYIGLVFMLAFFICAADIPFFEQFNTRLNSTALQWTSTPGFIVSMVVQEWSYLVYVILFILFVIAFLVYFKRMNRTAIKAYRTIPNKESWGIHFLKTIAFCLPALFFLFLGIRGRTSFKSPIRAGTAFFCNNRFLNQLGLNPVFTFLRSYLDDQKKENRTIHLTDEATALSKTKEYLLNGLNADTTISPIARKTITDGSPIKKNVVLVLMESMTAGNLARFGEKGQLTPTLDSLAANGYSFDNTYSAGIHTFNGVYSTLFSFPAMMNKNSMSNVEMPEYSGFSKVLKENGYHTLFVTTHDEQFDNLGGFIMGNNFDKLISQKDYPRNKIVNTWGVPDHYMFEFVIPELNKLGQTKEPFFATLLTTSNHRPFNIPTDIPFTPTHPEKEKGIIEYADWSIRHFLSEASKQSWFDNTIFVFVADHGAIIEREKYDMPLYYNHIPFIVYSPSFLKPTVYQQPAGQIDVFPTVMGLLNITYTNNTLGIDLLRQQRPFIYFSADDKIGVVDSQYFYTWYKDGRETLYDYQSNNMQNVIIPKKSLADSMRVYAFNSIQTAQWMISNHKTALPGTRK